MTEAVVLVTGGSGFIGTWVLHELLAEGKRAVVLARTITYYGRAESKA